MTTPPTNIVAAAKAAQAKWNIPASVSIAQWALESGWGKHMPPDSNNPFGMKARAGRDDPCVVVPTREVIHGKSITVNAAFRKFDSIADAFDAHAELLATAPVYAECRTNLPDPNDFADSLTGVYATDPNYGTLLKSIMRGSNLYQYDT